MEIIIDLLAKVGLDLTPDTLVIYLASAISSITPYVVDGLKALAKIAKDKIIPNIELSGWKGKLLGRPMKMAMAMIVGGGIQKLISVITAIPAAELAGMAVGLATSIGYSASRNKPPKK